MDNSETLATLSKQDKDKYKKKHNTEKLKISATNSTKSHIKS